MFINQYLRPTKVLAVIGIIGNITVIIGKVFMRNLCCTFIALELNRKPYKGIWRMQKKSTVTDILVSNLAFADFLFTAFCIWLKMR